MAKPCRHRLGLSALIALATVVISIGATPYEAWAEVDLTGDWHAELTVPGFGLVFDVLWPITQTGESVVVSPPNGFSGTINPSTGVFSLSAAPFFCPIQNVNLPVTLNGMLTPDGEAFTATIISYAAAPHGCAAFPARVWASRDPCGNGVVDPGEECDDGNEVNGDGCDANCTVTRCGNGVVTIGEQCDDGNQIAGDSCPADCSYSASRSLIRGNNKKPSRDHDGCGVEWYVLNPEQKPGRYHLPPHKQTCHDADLTCDLGGLDLTRAPIPDLTPGLCRFQVVVCLNNQDPDLPSCTPEGIASLNVLSPDPNKTTDPALQSVLSADRSALDYALLHLLDPRDPDAGYAKGPSLTDTQQNLCSAPFEIDVLAGSARRSITLATSTSISSSDQSTTSSLQLRCRRSR